MSLKNLSELSDQEFQLFFDSFDNVLCDCDGVLWQINKLFDGASEAIEILQKCGKQVNFVSNNCVAGLDNYVEKFKNFQIDADSNNLMYPTLAIIDYLKEIKFDKDILLMGPSAMKEDLINAGYNVKNFNTTPELVESKETLHKFFEVEESVGAIIVDIDINLNYEKLVKAISTLVRPDVLFLGGATETIFTMGPGKVLLGPGYFQNMMEQASGKKMMSFGKPSKILNEYVVKKFKITDPSRTLFIGDSLEQDIGFAINSGYQNLLVLTGATTLAKMKTCSKDDMPDYYLNSLGDLVSVIETKRNL